jgi:coproporphyrinogen III oxidase-like Fe-S oxidoreductase
LDESNSEEQIGFGLGASSYLDGYFFQNTTDMKRYLAYSPDYTKLIEKSIEIDDATAHKRYAALRLQLSEGFIHSYFTERFEHEPPDMLKKAFGSLQEQGLVEARDTGYALSTRGIVKLSLVQQTILST